jgi:predicted nucleic acid-binding protein
MKGIADTGFIVAFGNRDDGHHAWAMEVARKLTEPLLTCEAVLAEAVSHLRSSTYVLSLVVDEMLQVEFSVAENMARLAELAKRYQDQKPDLADLCVIRMSELHPKHIVLTTDHKDFRVYRRNKREAIPILCPPGRM